MSDVTLTNNENKKPTFRFSFIFRSLFLQLSEGLNVEEVTLEDIAGGGGTCPSPMKR